MNRLLRFSAQTKILTRDTITQLAGLTSGLAARFLRQREWDDGSHEAYPCNAAGTQTGPRVSAWNC